MAIPKAMLKSRIGWCSRTRLCCKRIIILVAIILFFCFLFRFERTTNWLFSRKVRQPKVVVGIMAEWQHMKQLVQASKETWVNELPYKTFYFVGRSNPENEALAKESNIVVLPYNDNEYPPVNKTFSMWYHLYTNEVMNYDFFIAVDSDTYVNAKHLEATIKQLTCRDCYVGYPSLGGSMQRSLGIEAPYCLGMGYIISRSTLLQFGPHINTCRTSFAARHSDTEMGRCIYKYAHNVSCTSATHPFKLVLQTTNEKNELVPRRSNARGQMDIDFPQAPPTDLFGAVMVHPLKQARFVYKFHQQVVLNLRPILPPVFAATSCVANPVLQQEIHPKNRSIPECPPSNTSKSLDAKSLKTYVLTLLGHEQRANQLINAFNGHGMRVERFNAIASCVGRTPTKLTAEQCRLRLIMTDFFNVALAENLQRVLVLEDDAIPHRHFGSRFQELLSDSRCGSYMLDTRSGGVLMLGGTVWEGGWHVLDRLSANEKGWCRNICSYTFGSFAVLYHKATFRTILTWLSTNSDEPYDHVFPYLSRLGYPVRLAVPNLVIKDVTHISLIDQPHNGTAYYDSKMRASIHRWNLADYMFTQYAHA